MKVELNPILPIFQRMGGVSLNGIVEKKNIERKKKTWLMMIKY